MNEAQWLSAQELNLRLESRLTALLQYASASVPFYRDHLSRIGATQSHLKGRAGLELFPVINKFTFRGGPLEPFLADHVPVHRRLERRTSGSTGEPFRHFLDREMLPVVYASHLFYDSWYGLRPFDRYLRISIPHDRDPVAVVAPFRVKLQQRITASLKHAYEKMTQEIVPVWEVDRKHLDSVYSRIAAFRPDFLFGYTSTIALLAEYLLECNRALPAPLRGVVTIGETLTPSRQKQIADCFGAPIVNRYGLREFGAWSAQNCPESQDAFHINTEMVALEILREDGSPASAGEPGRLVITDLLNRVMPFIRYDTGDIAVQGDLRNCPCGRGFPRFGRVEGRSAESITTPGGLTISSIVLGRYLREGGPAFKHKDHITCIRHYQAVQDGASRLRFLIVPASEFNEQRREWLRQDLHRLLRGEMEVLVDAVAEIPVEKFGKRPLIKVNR